MFSNPIHTIDDVISALDEIIKDAEKNNDPLGYFAALYQKVTVIVKQGINNQDFDDNPRMEKLDVVFAKRYIDALIAWKSGEPVTHSWEKTFSQSKSSKPIVLQHLLLGMNAHINLDLGIAAAEISDKKNIANLKNDFYKINEFLSSLVNEVQNNLSIIWPLLKKILQKTGQLDNLLVDFSLELARDGAWKSATEMAVLSESELEKFIKIRDKKLAGKSVIITDPKFGIKFLLWIIRVGERGSVTEKIGKLKSA